MATLRLSGGANRAGRWAMIAVAATALLIGGRPAGAADPARRPDPLDRPPREGSAPPSSVDEALERSLDRVLLDDPEDRRANLDDDRPTADEPGGADDAAGESDSEATGEAGLDRDDEQGARRSLGAGEDPFQRVAGRMRSAERAMRQPDQTKNVARLHDEILTDLDRLIQQLDQQCQACQGSACASPSPGQKTGQRGQPKPAAGKQPSGQKPGSEPSQGKGPAQQSTDLAGKGGASLPSPAEMESLLKDAWGNLPVREREQMLQSPPTRFLPKYQLLIEQYFKRLAEEQPR